MNDERIRVERAKETSVNFAADLIRGWMYLTHNGGSDPWNDERTAVLANNVSSFYNPWLDQ